MPGLRARAALARALKGLAGVAVAALLWQAMHASGRVDPRDFPGLGDILSAAGAALWDGEAWRAATVTLLAWLAGLALATLIGVSAGILVGRSAAVERAAGPLIEFIRPIPSVALIPIAILWFGLGLPMKIFIIAFACAWPILFNARAGVQGVDPRFVETARTLGCGRAATLFRVVLPAALPSIATGVRVAAAIGLALAITAEMLVGRGGIGFWLESSRMAGRAADVFAAVLIAGGVGVLVNAALLALERRALFWSPDQRGRE